MTEEVFKNIQVLKGVPADQLIPAMQFITVSLGVECDFCHVEGKLDKDDKKPKQTARKMMAMMFAINKYNFESHREVTCYSCHRGSTKPVGTPVINGQPPQPEMAETMNSEETLPPDLPTPGQLLDKYVKALGGASAIEKVATRVEKGTANVGGRQIPVEIFAKDPEKRAAIMHTPNGDNITAFDGQAGWLGAPGHLVRDMHGPDIDASRMDADLHFPLHIKQIFGELRPGLPGKIGDHQTYQVVGVREGQPPVQLFFDQESGLLLRLLRYGESPLGRNPTQIDYADYRDVDGVKTPFRWTIARPNGQFTIQIEQAQQNVPVDDARFTRPAEPAQKP